MSNLFRALASLLLLAIPSPALPAVPDPARSTVPPCLAVCPTGDISFHVVVRDAAANPEPGARVDLYLMACPGVHVCDPVAGDPYRWDGVNRIVSATTNAQGEVDFPLRAGGTCSSPDVSVRADGVLLRFVPVASPDQDGNLAVDASDVATIVALQGSGFLGADLNCDGAVTAADAAIARSHLGHRCSGPVPTESGGWEKLKVFYR